MDFIKPSITIIIHTSIASIHNTTISSRENLRKKPINNHHHQPFASKLVYRMPTNLKPISKNMKRRYSGCRVVIN